MVETIMGAQVLEQVVEYRGGIAIPILALVIGMAVCVGLVALGCAVSEYTVSEFGRIAGTWIGCILFLLAVAQGMRITRNTTGEYNDFLSSLPAGFAVTVPAYVIDVGECTDVAALSRQYTLRSYTGELEGNLVWALEK